MLSFKKKTVPESNDTKELDVLKSWKVTWYSTRTYAGKYSNSEMESEFFTSQNDAEAFRESLQSAHKLLKNSGELIRAICKENV